MDIRLEQGLPLINCELSYNDNQLILSDVLLDTGCAVSAFDIDAVSEIGLVPALDARIVSMYGIGGKSDYCLEMKPNKLMINQVMLHDFRIQLGTLKDTYGFDAILGIDFMISAGLRVDLKTLTALHAENVSLGRF